MNMNRTCLAIATLLMVAAPAAFANTAQVNVTGTITPAACQVTLANGGSFDFGEINAATLNSDRFTNIGPIATTLDIACDAPTRFAITGIDIHGDGGRAYNHYSLGTTTSGEEIGVFTALTRNVMTGSTTLYRTRSGNDGVTWTPSDAGVTSFVSKTTWEGYTTTLGDSSGPEALQQVTMGLEVLARIKATSQITLRDDQAINGGMVITVEFL